MASKKEQNKQKQKCPINSENKLMVTRGEVVGGWAKWGKGNGRCRLPVIE